MKILITTDTYFPIINGVVTSVNNLYNELKYKGHDVRILTLSNTGDEKVVEDVCHLKSVKIGIYPGARILVPFHNNLLKEIINWKPDLIHSQTEFSMMLVTKYISNKINVPHIHTYHTMYENYLGYLLGGKIISKNLAAKVTRTLLNSLNSIIVPTEKIKKLLLSYGVNKPIYVIATGIDLNRFNRQLTFEEKKEIILKLKLNEDDRIIAYVGRIGEEKNIKEILSLLPQVINEFKQLKLLIVGGGPYLDNLKKQVEKLHLENNVIFTGMIKQEEVYKYYKIAEIFVTASTSETQGLTYIEALSSGCPIVCKYDSCIDGVIEQGRNGFFYKNKYEFPYFINKILKNNSLKDSMKKEAAIKATQYSKEIFANKVLNIYSSVKKANNEANTSIKLVNHKE